MQRVPVMAGLRCLELADAARVERLARGKNVRVIRRRRDRQIVEIQLLPCGDDSQQAARRGNPLSYSSDTESADNPANVWRFRRIPKRARGAFGAVVNDCAA